MINGRGCKQKFFWLVLAAFNGLFVFGPFYQLEICSEIYHSILHDSLPTDIESDAIPSSPSLSLCLARSLYPSLASLRRNVGNISAKSLRHHLVIVKQSPGQLQEKASLCFLAHSLCFLSSFYTHTHMHLFTHIHALIHVCVPQQFAKISRLFILFFGALIDASLMVPKCNCICLCILRFLPDLLMSTYS